MKERIEKIQAGLAKDQLDGLVVSKGSDIKYLTGFTGEYGVAVLFITPDKGYFITDSRFVNQAGQETSGLEVVGYPSGSSYFDQTGRLVQAEGVKRCGFYGGDLSYAAYYAMTKPCPDTEFVQANPYVADMRAIKTPEEIETIRKACRISERSFYALLDAIKPGVTEIDLANELEYQFRSRGGSGFCFETIVASGPDNGANCHATPSSRKICEGDFITFDFGTYYNGYCSDITRTVCVGKPANPELVRIFEVVKAAKNAGEAALRPGLAMNELNAVIHQVVNEAGYTIPHGPGHSFGLEIHEDPYINSSNEYRLKPGVIHTLEPGIYLPGVGGVRQEDDYLITETGYERLTHITDVLIIV